MLTESITGALWRWGHFRNNTTFFFVLIIQEDTRMVKVIMDRVCMKQKEGKQVYTFWFVS